MGYPTILVVTLVIFSLCSCNSKDENYLESPVVKRSDLYYLDLVDTLDVFVPATAFSTHLQNFLFRDSILIGRNGNQFDFFNISSQSYMYSFSLDENFFTRVAGFYVHNLDSIFIAEEPRNIVLIDGNGSITRRWILNENELRPLYNNMDINYFSDFSEPIQFFDSDKKLIHLTFTCADIWFIDDKENYQLHGTYDLAKNSWVSTFGKYSGVYTSKNPIKYPFVYSNPFCLTVNENSYVSFPMDHNVYLYNNTTGELLMEKAIPSKYIKELPTPMAFDNDDFQSERNFVIQAAYYGRLEYHESLNLFTRIARHENSLRESDGQLSSPQKKSLSVIIFNEELNIIGEEFFDGESPLLGFGGDLRLSRGVSTKNGFIATLKPKHTNSDDTLSYRIQYQIKR